MYNHWKVDLSDSVKAISKIKDTILPNLISGEIISIEETQNEILLMFDKYSGIDYLRKDNNGLQGIASRVQFGKEDDKAPIAWNTFTIRYERDSGAKTEYEKRMYQIKHGYFYPAYTLQAYFDNRKDMNLLSVAVVKTVELYRYAEENFDKLGQNKSNNVFKFVRWSELDKSIIKIYQNY